MAIRLRDKKQRALSTLQVQEARREFFYNLRTTRSLAEEYSISERTMKDVVNGKRSYANIPDDISDVDKEMRRAHKILASQPESQRQANKREMDKWIREGTIPPPPDLIWEPPSEDRFKVKRQEVKPIKFWRDFK